MKSEEMKVRQTELWERARKAILKFVVDRGGVSELRPMHDYSESNFFIGHQSFSRMMEGFVAEGLVTFDDMEQKATLTEEGRQFVG
jgi:hypothetical protein